MFKSTRSATEIGQHALITIGLGGFFGVITGTSQAIIRNRSVYQYAKVVGSRSILIAAAFGFVRESILYCLGCEYRVLPDIYYSGATEFGGFTVGYLTGKFKGTPRLTVVGPITGWIWSVAIYHMLYGGNKKLWLTESPFELPSTEETSNI